jgi:hypothetical protein
MKEMSSNSAEVRAMLLELLPKIKTTKGALNAQAVGMDFLCSLLMPYWTGLRVLRRTCRQDYETLFHVVILSKHHHHHGIFWLFIVGLFCYICIFYYLYVYYLT